MCDTYKCWAALLIRSFCWKSECFWKVWGPKPPQVLPSGNCSASKKDQGVVTHCHLNHITASALPDWEDWTSSKLLNIDCRLLCFVVKILQQILSLSECGALLRSSTRFTLTCEWWKDLQYEDTETIHLKVRKAQARKNKPGIEGKTCEEKHSESLPVVFPHYPQFIVSVILPGNDPSGHRNNSCSHRGPSSVSTSLHRIDVKYNVCFLLHKVAVKSLPWHIATLLHL